MKDGKALIGVSIFLCLVFGVSMLFLIMMYTKKEDSSEGYAHIYQDGNLVKTVSLKKDDTFLIEGENGAYNKIQIKDGSIGVVEASCPDFLCGNMGFISHGPIPITCLPNRLVIEIKSGKEIQTDAGKSVTTEEVDGVVY